MIRLFRILWGMAVVLMLVTALLANWLPILLGGVVGGLLTAGCWWLLSPSGRAASEPAPRTWPRGNPDRELPHG